METNDKFIHRKFKAGILRKRRTKVCNINITELLKRYQSDGSSTRIEYELMIHAHFLLS